MRHSNMVESFMSYDLKRGNGIKYPFILEPLHDREGSGIVHVLHDEPVDRLAVLAVYARGLDELGLDAGDGLGVGVGVEVDGECVDHFGR
jgi:hypothetical protein